MSDNKRLYYQSCLKAKCSTLIRKTKTVVNNKGRVWKVQYSAVFGHTVPFWGIWDETTKGTITLNVVHESGEPEKNWRLVSPLVAIRGDNFKDVNEETLTAAFAEHYKSFALKGLFGVKEGKK